MRGGDVRSEALFSYVSYERRVPVDHPLRPIRKIVDEGLLLPAVPILLMTSPRSAQSLPRGDCTTHRWRKRIRTLGPSRDGVTDSRGGEGAAG